jgi:hypothetical protein
MKFPFMNPSVYSIIKACRAFSPAQQPQLLIIIFLFPFNLGFQVKKIKVLA